MVPTGTDGDRPSLGTISIMVCTGCTGVQESGERLEVKSSGQHEGKWGTSVAFSSILLETKAR